MFDQAGVIATTSLGELVDTAALLACQPLPAGNRVAIVSNAGGAGVLAADACADHGLQVVKLGAATRRALRGLLPAGCGGHRAGGHRPGGDDRYLPRLRGGGGRRRRRRRGARGGGAHGFLRPECRGGRGGRQQAARGRPARPGRVRATAQAPARRRAAVRPTRGHRPSGRSPAADPLPVRRRPSSTWRRRLSPECPVTPTRRARPARSATRPAIRPGACASAARSPS